MDPRIIASLTVLALIGLAVEYFTGLIGRALGAVWQRLHSVAPRAADDRTGPVSAVRPSLPAATQRPQRTAPSQPGNGQPGSKPGLPGPVGNAGRARVEPAVMANGSAHDARADRSYMPPATRDALATANGSPAARTEVGDHDAAVSTLPPPPARPPLEAIAVRAAAPAVLEAASAAADRIAPPIPGDSRSTAESEAMARAAARIVQIVEQLKAVGSSLARSGGLPAAAPALGPLKQLALDYDLDDVMKISDVLPNGGVIGYYREVARTGLELEKLFRDAARIRSLANGDAVLEGNRSALRRAVADEIARGTLLAASLRRPAEEPLEPGRNAAARPGPTPPE